MQTSGSNTGNGQSGDTSKPFRAQAVWFKKIEWETVDNIITAHRDAILITVNGETHITRVPAFMDSEQRIFELWDSHPEQFRKVDLNEKSVP